MHVNSKKIIHLTPPHIATAHIKEKIICIRAHRERIFNVSVEKTHNKLLCHNYGQGGAGWTFLFGCVNESIRQFESHLEQDPTLRDNPICVIGAGCYGLLTAITLARKGYSVHIIAQDIDSIPSYKAAGFFFPRPRQSASAEEITIYRTLGIESYTVYREIAAGKHPFIKQGPKLLPAYYGLDIDPGFGPYIAEGLIEKPELVTIDFGSGKSYDVLEYNTVFINPAIIMEELERTKDKLGITITRATVETFDDISESIIFNCSNLGAKKLTHDKRLIPVQGHLITLQDQPIEQLQYMLNVMVTMTSIKGNPRDEMIYFAPKESGILGITFLRGQDSLTTNLHEFDRLLLRCQDYFGTE